MHPKNGSAGPAVTGTANPAPPGPHLELDDGRTVALTESESLRLELLATQGKLFDSQIQLLTRAKQEASDSGAKIVAAAIERDRAEHAAKVPLALAANAPLADPELPPQDPPAAA